MYVSFDVFYFMLSLKQEKVTKELFLPALTHN